MYREEFAVSTHQPERLRGPNYLLREVSLVEINNLVRDSLRCSWIVGRRHQRFSLGTVAMLLVASYWVSGSDLWKLNSTGP
jgi:hypothetical protein